MGVSEYEVDFDGLYRKHVNVMYVCDSEVILIDRNNYFTEDRH